MHHAEIAKNAYYVNEESSNKWKHFNSILFQILLIGELKFD